MKKLIGVFVIVLAMCTCSMAAQKKALGDINIDSFTSDTQIMFQGAGDDHLALAWWIPNEYWESILARDATTSASDKTAMMDAMSGVSLLAVVQADVSSLGAFNFYSKAEISRNMIISFTDANGKKVRMTPLKTLKPDLEVVLSVFKPILGAAMGNLGNNMHFYVLNDVSEASNRLMDPYQQGLLNIQLSNRDAVSMTSNIEMPLNALFVPRKCPNGKDAHISWNYCPWTGQRLED